ncbi:hypothetical protein NDU88_006383 [Pleurodeles waltl]|uniref:Reverse transcriptase RNase H-like domain-containing protein n=1 Tax=Pleurodeles waltl TaxID=8319 RepID=A0AAV7VQD0_PLEWA|nr:hypothetical protein NDU88_006383 [Pleurodeles waltl]
MWSAENPLSQLTEPRERGDNRRSQENHGPAGVAGVKCVSGKDENQPPRRPPGLEEGRRDILPRPLRDPKSNKRIILFASRSLSPAGENYPNMEREALACVWA